MLHLKPTRRFGSIHKVVATSKKSLVPQKYFNTTPLVTYSGSHGSTLATTTTSTFPHCHQHLFHQPIKFPLIHHNFPTGGIQIVLRRKTFLHETYSTLCKLTSSVGILAQFNVRDYAFVHSCLNNLHAPLIVRLLGGALCLFGLSLDVCFRR